MDDLVTSDSDSREDLSLQPTPPETKTITEGSVETKEKTNNHQSESEDSGKSTNGPEFMLTKEAEMLLSGKSITENMFSNVENFPDADVRAKIERITRQSSFFAHRIFSNLHLTTSLTDFNLQNFVSEKEKELLKEKDSLISAKAEGRREVILAIAEELCKYECEQTKIYEFFYQEIERNKKLTSVLEKMYSKHRKSLGIIDKMKDYFGKDLVQEHITLKKQIKELTDKNQELSTEISNLKKGVQSAFEPPGKRRCIETSTTIISETRVVKSKSQESIIECKGNVGPSKLEERKTNENSNGDDEDDDVTIIGEEGFPKITFEDLPTLETKLVKKSDELGNYFNLSWDISNKKPCSVKIDSYDILFTLNGKNIQRLDSMPAKPLPLGIDLRHVKTKTYFTVRARSGGVVGPISRFQLINPKS